MPGFELIDNLEKKAVNKIFSEGAVFFAHGFEKLRKRFHVREFEQLAKKKLGSKFSLAVTSGTSATFACSWKLQHENSLKTENSFLYHLTYLVQTRLF